MPPTIVTKYNSNSAQYKAWRAPSPWFVVQRSKEADLKNVQHSSGVTLGHAMSSHFKGKQHQEEEKTQMQKRETWERSSFGSCFRTYFSDVRFWKAVDTVHKHNGTVHCRIGGCLAIKLALRRGSSLILGIQGSLVYIIAFSFSFFCFFHFNTLVSHKISDC